MTAQREANTVLVPADKLRELQIANANLRAEIEQLKTIHNQTVKDGVAGFNAAIEHNVVLRQQLAASQLETKRLRDIMQQIAGHQECTPPFYWWQIYAREALAQPSDTSALDAYVAEKTKALEGEISRLKDKDDACDDAWFKVDELTRQRDLAVSALQCYVPDLPQGTTKAEQALAAIKESEVK